MFCAAIAFAVLTVAPVEALFAHPIHMSFTEIRFVERDNSVEISVRVFSNDFSAAVARYSNTRLGPDSLIDSHRGVTYLLANIRLAGRRGAPITLVPCGITRANDMLRFCFRGRLPSPGESVQVANAVMTELFNDQVNVVQSIVGKRRASRMFVRGDGHKRMP